MNVLDILKNRGFVHQLTNENALQKNSANPITFYIGFDPTADSLHVGSLMGIMAAVHMQKLGHIPILLIGGGTGIVGDPSGKAEDRNMLSYETLNYNETCIKQQLEHFIQLGEEKGYVLNNYDWLQDLHYLTFLRDVGKYFRVNQMLENDTYKLKIENDQGLSFIEFNYQLLQAYDFKVLFEKYNCTLQIGGSDQWANITAGTALIRRSLGKEAFGLTMPLLTTSSGKKMGKTEQGAIWLDKNKTSVFDFYQFWINTADTDVKRFLKIFTFLDPKNIDALPFSTAEEMNATKKILAKAVTEIVHGQVETKKAIERSEEIFGGKMNALNSEVVTVHIGDDLIDIIHNFDTTLSKSEIRRRITAGAIKVNGISLTEDTLKIQSNLFVENTAFVSITKKSFFSISL